MRNLSELTPEECVKIATIAFPEVKWSVVQPENKWTGFDLVSSENGEDEIEKYIFQISYGSGDKPRFAFFENLWEYPVSVSEIEAINIYLKSISVTI